MNPATTRLAARWDEFPEPPHAADVMVTKRQWGAFYGTDLDLQLRRRGMRTIIIGRHRHQHGRRIDGAQRLGTRLRCWSICEDLCADLNAETHASSFKHIFPRLACIASSEAITRMKPGWR